MKKSDQIAPIYLDIHIEEVRQGRHLRVLHIRAAHPTAVASTVDDNSVKTELHVNSDRKNTKENSIVVNFSTVFSCNQVVFFLHGVGGSAETWQRQLDQFPDYNVVAVHFIGHGYSPISTVKEDYSFYEILNDVLAIFDKYSSVTGANVIVGHSYG